MCDELSVFIDRHIYLVSSMKHINVISVKMVSDMNVDGGYRNDTEVEDILSVVTARQQLKKLMLNSIILMR